MLCSSSPRDKDKFSERSRECIFVGYPFRTKGWRLYDIDRNEFFISRDIIFLEDMFPGIKDTSWVSPPILQVNTPSDDWLVPMLSFRGALTLLLILYRKRWVYQPPQFHQKTYHLLQLRLLILLISYHQLLLRLKCHHHHQRITRLLHLLRILLNHNLRPHLQEYPRFSGVDIGQRDILFYSRTCDSCYYGYKPPSRSCTL